MCHCMFFFYYSSGYHRDLHSFPTRRSSDLRISRSATIHRPNTFQKYSLASRAMSGLRCTNTTHFPRTGRSEEHTSELQSRQYLVCRLLLEKKKNKQKLITQRSEEITHDIHT